MLEEKKENTKIMSKKTRVIPNPYADQQYIGGHDFAGYKMKYMAEKESDYDLFRAWGKTKEIAKKNVEMMVASAHAKHNEKALEERVKALEKQVADLIYHLNPHF